MELEELLYEKIKSEMSKWGKTGIYAVYFGVIANPTDGNKPHFIIGCGKEGHNENITGKWHLALCPMNETEITKDKKTAKAVTEWLKSQGVEKIGEYDPADTAKGPAGCYELVQLGVDIAKKLFAEGFIKSAFGEDIPIIFDDMETSGYCIEATKAANPKGLADEFIKSASKKKKAAAEADAPKGIFKLVLLFPNALFIMLVCLVAGGIAFPLKTNGIVKLVLLGISIISDIQKKLQLKKEGSLPAGGKTALFMAADLIIACVIAFSVNIIPDRILALVAFVAVIAFSLADGKLSGDSFKNTGK